MQTQIDAGKQHQPRLTPASRGSNSAEGAPLHPILQLQQQAGNQAVQALLRTGSIQLKSAISNPDDPEEREAEEVAHQIMRSPAAFPASHCSCAAGEEMCDECQQKQSSTAILRSASPHSASAPHLSAAPHPTPAPHSTPSQIPRIVTDVLRSPGHPLDPATRAFFEPRFGQDFSHVRVHTGPEASASARSISAHAYTAGSNIVFAPGQYSPDTTPGRTLLAHELTHTVQQSGIPRQTESSVRNAWDDVGNSGARTAEESAASDRAARFEISGLTAPRIQRQPSDSSASADQSPSAPTAEDQPVIEADAITDEDYLGLTGIPPDILPEGVLIKDLKQWADPIVNAPADTLPPGIGTPATEASGRASQVAGVGPATVPNPMAYVPENATGILWTPGHMSVFAKANGELIVRGFRASLLTHAVGEVSFAAKTRLTEGVPGGFKNDLFYTRWGSQIVIYVPTDSDTARSFKEELAQTEYDLTYKWSSPRPDAPQGSTERRMFDYLEKKLGDGFAIQCSYNCITVPAREIGKAIGIEPQVNTPAGKLNIITGSTNGGPPDPHEAGRAKRMEEFMRNPDLASAKPGATKVGMTPAAGKTLGVVRLAGKVWLVYGAVSSLRRIWDADLDQLPGVLLEEGAAWGGGVAGSELAGAISSGIGDAVYVASGTEFSTLFVVGSTGLSLGLAYLGARAGEWAVGAVENLYEFVVNLPEEIRMFSNVVAMGLTAFQETGRVVNQTLVYIFIRPAVLRHESINPANWDLRRLPPGALNAVYGFGIAAWKRLSPLGINDFANESQKSFGDLGVDQSFAVALSNVLAPEGIPIAPAELLAMPPGDFAKFLQQLGFLRFIKDPEAIADDMLTDEGHKINEQQANVRTAPVIGKRASINPNNWNLQAAGQGQKVISDLGFQIWERLRSLDFDDFDRQSEESLAALGVSRATAITAARAIFKPLTVGFSRVEDESVPEETIEEFADSMLKGTPTDLITQLKANRLLEFIQEPSTIAQLSVQWLRAGYQPW